MKKLPKLPVLMIIEERDNNIGWMRVYIKLFSHIRKALKTYLLLSTIMDFDGGAHTKKVRTNDNNKFAVYFFTIFFTVYQYSAWNDFSYSMHRQTFLNSQ